MPPLYEKKAPDEDKEEDAAASVGFCKYFQSLDPAPKGTIRLFDRSEFYSSYGHDALFVAKEVYRTNTVIRWIGPKNFVFDPTKPNHPHGLPSCSLSRAAAVSFLRECLTSRQLRVQILTPDTGGPSGKLATKWSVSRQASPGNLEPLADLLFASTDILSAPVIASVWVKGSAGSQGGRTVGVAFADTSVRTLGMSEFAERDEGWGNTESLMIQLGVKEVVLPTMATGKGKEGEEAGGANEYGQLRELLEDVGIVVTERKKSEFSAKNVEQDVNRLLEGDLQLATRPEYDFKVALTAVNPLIVYLDLLSSTLNFGSYKLVTHDLGQFMRLDGSALRALHLFPDTSSLSAVATSGSAAARSMSVFGLLNRCKTSQGTRLLGRWIKQPLVNLHEIQKRQDLVAVFASDDLCRQVLRDDFLRSMPDLTRISKRFAKQVASLEDVVRVYQAVVRVPEMVEALERVQTEDDEGKQLLKDVYLDHFAACSAELAKLVEMVETTIDLDELSSHRFVIKADFDEELQELQSALERTRDGLDEEHARVADVLGLGTDPKSPLHFEQHQVYGYVFRLTRKEAGKLRGKKEIIELSNRNNGTYFTTKQLKELNNDQKDLTQKYERKQSSLVKEVVNVAATFCPILEKLNEVVAHLDAIVNFAHVSLSAPVAYVRPTVHPKGEGDVVLSESRHPCLEAQEDVTFIPNDVSMVRGESEFLIITGPNMGGKSTYARQIGVIAIMAQMGMNVPCASASLPVFDTVLARVGAGDSQLKGVSTFMAEMLETATILKSATRDSLIIIDELGRGTSTYDGFGLAWAISEHIATEIRAFCLFATHFHELTSLEKEIAHVRNLHVVAHVDDISPEGKATSLAGGDITLLYKVEPGICDRSFGIHVAEMARFPEDVIKLAKRKADELEDFGDADAGEEGRKRVAVVDEEATAEGTALVEEMLTVWSQAPDEDDDGGDGDGDGDGEDGGEREQGEVDGDVVMKEASGGVEQRRWKREVKRLKKVYEEFRPRLEANEWVKAVLLETY